MAADIRETAWDGLSYEEKNRELYKRQKHLLEDFLAHGAISKEQYRKSLDCLTEKMGDGKKEQMGSSC